MTTVAKGDRPAGSVIRSGRRDEPVPGREGRDDARQLPFECPDDGGCIRKILGVEDAIRLTDDMIKANAVPSDVPPWHRTTRWWPTGA